MSKNYNKCASCGKNIKLPAKFIHISFPNGKEKHNLMCSEKCIFNYAKRLGRRDAIKPQIDTLNNHIDYLIKHGDDRDSRIIEILTCVKNAIRKLLGVEEKDE